MHFVSKSTLIMLVFFSPDLPAGSSRSFFFLLKHMIKNQDPEITDELTLIDFGETQLSYSYQDSFDPDLGLPSQVALSLFFNELDRSYTQREQALIFENLESVQIVRCGKTAVVLHLKNNKRFLIIFDQQKEVIYQSIAEENVA